VTNVYPPTSLPFVCVYPHKRLQDHKVRLFIDHAASECKRILAEGGVLGSCNSAENEISTADIGTTIFQMR